MSVTAARFQRAKDRLPDLVEYLREMAEVLDDTRKPDVLTYCHQLTDDRNGRTMWLFTEGVN